MNTDIEQLVRLLARLPGLGPRSARRSVLYLMKHKQDILQPLLQSMHSVQEKMTFCQKCYNLDTTNPCAICQDERRDRTTVCIVQDVADLWAMERSQIYRGRYFVLGGVLSAVEGIGPEDIHLHDIPPFVKEQEIQEVILALNATMEGQITSNYISQELTGQDLKITALARGIPLGSELDYLDEGTLTTALNARLQVG